MRTDSFLLVYDDNCPFCCWYTGRFVHAGLLKAEHRKPFSTLEDRWMKVIDLDRGRNEIPLIDTSTNR